MIRSIALWRNPMTNTSHCHFDRCSGAHSLVISTDAAPAASGEISWPFLFRHEHPQEISRLRYRSARDDKIGRVLAPRSRWQKKMGALHPAQDDKPLIVISTKAAAPIPLSFRPSNLLRVEKSHDHFYSGTNIHRRSLDCAIAPLEMTK